MPSPLEPRDPIGADASIDRRTLLRWFGVGAAASALAACSSGSRGGSGSSTSRPTVSLPTTSGPPAPIPWDTLQSKLTGRVVLPGNAAYLTDLQLYDPRFDDVRPGAIAYCANPTDVQRSIEFARTNAVALTARSGGHSYAGYSTNRGLVIDVSAMNDVTTSGSSASVGAGARLIDLYTNLNSHGVSIPGGSCPTVGIAGLALGGGIGVVARKYGLTSDAISAVQMVTADGRLVTATASTDDDLYWASRGGGGGNFGVVTSFTFDTFPVGDVGLFTLRWPWAAAPNLVPAWMAWIADAPDELWSNCILESPGKGGAPLLQVGGIWVGDASDVAPFLDRLVTAAGSAPSNRFSETIPLAHAMYVEAGCAQLSQSACHTTGQTPNAQLSRGPTFAASNYVDEPLSDAGVRAVVGGISDRITGQLPGAIAFDAYGGAINRVHASDTAFVHRSSLCCAQYSVSYNSTDSAAAVQEHQAWIASYGAALRPFVSKAAYQNYIDPTLPDSLDAYYGANLARLRNVKKKWDPQNVFHFAQSIPPAT